MPRAIRYGLVIAATAVLWLAAPADAGLAAVTTAASSVDIADVQPSHGEVVGVAMPVTVRFAKPIVNRALAEKTIQVVTPTDTTGRFSWLNDNVVQWIPDEFWPAHSEIEVKANGLDTRFQTGSTVLGVASISEHTFTVSIDEQVARVMPASMGKPSRPTPIGSFTALEKQRRVTFDSRTIGIPLSSPEGYLITGQWAVRVTWGGVYVHSAPWSVASQGNSNVSHGCINLSPENAEWYFNTVSVGDPIVVQA